MKSLVLSLFLIFGLVSYSFADDRVRVQVQFKKFIWTCPVCGEEEILDANMSGQNVYTHTCSKGHKFNQSGSNMREYNGSLTYTPEEYANLKDTDKVKEKKDKVDAWMYEVKHPVPYIPPTLKELEKMKADKLAEVEDLQRQINEKTPIIISD
jgi:predicted RNA-binding Zn-ribbon protein involved in translation (DUF1610 family)